ncbi:MAG TPA: MarR family transcriptional regulator [Gemmatimonadales bacterium]
MGEMSREVLIALRRIIHSVDTHSRSLLQRCGLTGPQLLLLREIGDGEMSVGLLAKAVSLSQATVTGVLDRLERQELVTRRRGAADRRQVLVRVTGKGQRLAAQAPPPFREVFLRRFAELEDWEQVQVLSSLHRVVALMQPEGLGVGALLTIEALPGDGPDAAAMLQV